jgi:DME family drug/metabolite transporter
VDLAVALACIAGTGWALNIVVVRWALDRTGAPSMAGAFVGIASSAAMVLALAIVFGGAAPGLSDIWRFAIVGAVAPGSSQGLFLASIRSIGPSRSSVLVGTAPMFGVLLAIVLLGENWELAILLGTSLTVLGGAAISWERGRGLLNAGVLFALATAMTFGMRDVIAREVTTGTNLSTLWSAAIVLGSASVVLWVMMSVVERGGVARGLSAAFPEFLLSGLMIGLALPMLLAALSRGRVGIVTPLSNATQNTVVVVLSGIFFGARERSTKVVLALAMVVSGGVLISTR